MTTLLGKKLAKIKEIAEGNTSACSLETVTKSFEF